MSECSRLIRLTDPLPQLSIGLAVLCLPVLRYTHPEWPRPIRVQLLFPVLYILASAMITVVPMAASPRETGIGTAIILTGVPVYLTLIAWKNKPTFIRRSLGESNVFCV